MPQALCQRSWSWTVLWRSTGHSRTNTKKDVLFMIGDWNAKVGSQEIHGEMSKFGLGVQNEAEQSLTEFCQESALDIANTLFQQQKRLHMDPRFSILTWDWLYSLQMDKLHTVSKTRPGALCGSDYKLLIAKFRQIEESRKKPLGYSGMT